MSLILLVSLISIVVFALLSMAAHHLRTSVIYLGIFSLISSFLFVLYSAPDVALAEAIIGSSLTTLLYLIALSRGNSLERKNINGFDRRLAFLIVFFTIVVVSVIYLYTENIMITGYPSMSRYISDYVSDTGAKNAVAGIYLNYRLLDTIFEALLLIVSVTAVIHFSWRNIDE